MWEPADERIELPGAVDDLQRLDRIGDAGEFVEITAVLPDVLVAGLLSCRLDARRAKPFVPRGCVGQDGI